MSQLTTIIHVLDDNLPHLTSGERLVLAGKIVQALERPDFEQLGRETFYSPVDWAEAWNALARPDLWPTLLSVYRAIPQHPLEIARALRAVTS